MDKKLNFTDLSNFFAKALGVPVAEAESFVHAFFDVIVEGLEKDGSVKINGLGTFKVVEVESRSSVNINTGERFEIDGHKRLTFVPADSLKDIINAPFAMFEPVEVDDDIDDDEEEEKELHVEDASVVEEGVAEDASMIEEPVNVIVTEEVAAVVEEELPVDEESTDEVVSVTEEIPVTVEASIEEVSVAPAVSVEIEEEMPQDAIETNFDSVAVGEIEEEMPIEESDYISEKSETVDEPVAEHVETPVEEVVNDEQSVVAEKQPCEKLEEKADNEIVAVPLEKEKREKKTIVVEEKSLYFDTLPRKKKSNKLLKFSLVFAFILIGGAAAFVGFYLYKNNYFFARTVNEKNVVAETMETPPVVDVPADTIAQVADTVVVAEDSLVVAVTDTIIVEQPAAEQKDTVVEQPQIKEEKKKEENVERFRIVEALAVRELSTIFVADTTDYKIVGTMCKHKVKSEETLIRISLNYYGDKRLWPYIVKYNNMLRPNDLACDMVLKIPRLVPKK